MVIEVVLALQHRNEYSRLMVVMSICLSIPHPGSLKCIIYVCLFFTHVKQNKTLGKFLFLFCFVCLFVVVFFLFFFLFFFLGGGGCFVVFVCLFVCFRKDT